MFPRLMGIAQWNLAWAFGEIASIAQAVATLSRVFGPSVTLENSIHRLMPGGKLLPLRHPSLRRLLFFITKGELA